MNLPSQLIALRKQSRDLPIAERAEVSCRLAKQFEKAGDYEAAYEALEEFWPNRERTPMVEGLEQTTAAEILLRVGALAGWLGSTRQAEGSQETAKNLITQSIDIFNQLGQTDRVAEARGELALCYWREGSYDEARITLADALGMLRDEYGDLKAVLLIRAGIIEVWAQRLNEAARFLNEAAPLLKASNDDALKGAFHDEQAVLFMRLSEGVNSSDYVDRALIEYAAASFHFEQAGHHLFQGRVENNLGYLYFTLGRFSDAHVHLNHARTLFRELGDIGTAAQVDETRARTLIAQGRFAEAERIVRTSVIALEKGGEQALLAEALTTEGVALARLGRSGQSKVALERAIEVSETTGDPEGAGRAKLSIIEELGDQLPLEELVPIYRSAIDLLKESEDPSAAKRLIACAGELLDALVRIERDVKRSPDHDWEGFSLKEHLRNGERAVIEKALRDANGSVTKAARLLGFKHHQSLIYLINSRHKELLKIRSIVRQRRQHIFSKPRRAGRNARKRSPKRLTSQVSILHVEDHQIVAQLVGDILAAEDWQVELCMDGDTALRKLTGYDPYDVLVIDNNLPGLSGLELVQRARTITHRRRTPIIMLSGDDVEKEAWRAGVDDFVRKPEAATQLVSAITRLLQKRNESTEIKATKA